MTTSLPPCPACNSAFAYEDNANFVCSECGHEWPQAAPEAATQTSRVVKDAFGNLLADGDSVTIIKELKVRGSSLAVKIGTKVRNIRLVDGDHDIDCKIDGIGAMGLKSEFVKKA
jgi:protein PhnA